MNSLKIKILGLTIGFMVISVGLATLLHLSAQEKILTRFVDQNSRVVAETIRNSIISGMISGQQEETLAILEKIRHEPAIRAVRVFAEDGRIFASTDPLEVGDHIESSIYHAFRSGRQSLTDAHSGEPVHDSLLPISNSQSCRSCHAGDGPVLGVLNVRLSLAELNAFHQQGRRSVILSSAAMLAITFVAITVFILVYVDTPIRRLVEGMRRLEEGDFEHARTSIRSSDEMALLSTKFNLTVERLKTLIDTKVRQEREIAVAKEKLAHHDLIQKMNLALEDRLREIEFLNINLEERIEEIEEANYKVADLAGVLEDKNTTLAQAVARLSALNGIGLVINSTMHLEELFRLLISKTMETLQASIGYILLIERNTGMLRIGGCLGLDTPPAPDMQIPIKAGGVSNWVIRHRQPLLVRNFADHSELTRESLLGFVRETVICAPLIIKEQVIGTITMANRRDESPFGTEDLDLLSTIAAQASVAINNARLYEEQENTYLTTVQALVSAIEASDAYTRGHSERVTRFSLALARQLGLTPEAIKRLEQAAILHDIGKIGIDLALLHKEGTLSGRDLDLLKEHPAIGVRILEPIPFLKNVLAIISQHHEQFDGQGYPYGIRGEELLLEARILAVADTYDAMTSDRPYRRALSHETALQEIRDHSGTQFDPQVVQSFLEIWANGPPGN